MPSFEMASRAHLSWRRRGPSEPRSEFEPAITSDQYTTIAILRACSFLNMRTVLQGASPEGAGIL